MTDEQQPQSPQGSTPSGPGPNLNRRAQDAQRDANGTAELAPAEVHAGVAEPWLAAFNRRWNDPKSPHLVRVDAAVTLVGAETTFDNL